MKDIFIILSVLFFTSCVSDKTVEIPEEHFDKNQISFTKQQMELAEIKTGEIEYLPIAEQIYCSGRVEATPQNRAKISVPVEGYVKSISVRDGQNVGKGVVMIILQHPIYIDIQKNYLQTKSQLNLLEKEYNRQKTLKENNAGTGKVYERSLAEYEELKIELEALRLKLKLINIDASKISADNIKQSIPVLSPISGTINEMNITIGQFIEPDDVLLEIIGDKDFQIELQVFEKDINKVKVGQLVIFDCNMPESFGSVHSGRVSNIGNFVDDISKTFKVVASSDVIYPGMRHGIFLNGRIQLSEEKLAALPESAIENEGARQFVFIATSDTSFIRQYVETGINENGYFTISEPDLSGKTIVIKGANYLKAELASD